MIDDTQVRELLDEAGEDITAGPLDPAALMARSRRLTRRRALTGLAAAAVASLLVWGGLTWAEPFGSSGPSAAGPPNRSSQGPFINTSPSPSNSVMQALVGGVIEVSSNGCLVVRNGGTVTDLFWPYGFSVDTGPDGSVAVLDETGHRVATVGRSFTAAGGYVQIRDLACRAGGGHADVMAIDAEIKQGAAGSPVHQP